MWRGFPKRILRAVSVALIAVSLVATALAHRAPSTDEIALEAYILIGGDLGGLCVPLGSDGEGPHNHDCPVCQLGHALVLPEAGFTLVAANHAFVAKIVAPRLERARRVFVDPANRMRAPPLA